MGSDNRPTGCSVHAIIIIIICIIIIIYMKKKLLDIAWLRAVQFKLIMNG